MNKEEAMGEVVRGKLDLTVDENDLVNEWKEQAALMLDYGILLADAMEIEDACKAKLSIIAAELDKDIREAPEEYGLQKATDTIVINAIPGQPEYQAATKKLNKARYEVRVLRAAVDALAHRKSTLQGITDLFLRQWYADPKSKAQPAELRDAVDEGPPTKTIQGRRKRRGRREE